MLISLHLPKTAGSSFSSSLKEFYGEHISLDYNDAPINTSSLKRKRRALKMCIYNAMRLPDHEECVHGHFLPLKYLLCKNTIFVTWMRDPIERLASHYFYWQRNYNPLTAPALHKRVVEENWTLEKFCFSPLLRNLYSQFLWGFPLRRFKFIGITEHYGTELDYFSHKFIGTKFKAHDKNINPNQITKAYIEDKTLRHHLEKYHRKDMVLYKQALTLRLTNRQA